MYEIMETSVRIKEAIRKKWLTDTIAEIAESEGMQPLRTRAVSLS